MNDKSPMTSSQVVDAIAQIAGTSSTKAKQELLAGFMQDPTFKRGHPRRRQRARA
jgi:hypothetical protein